MTATQLEAYRLMHEGAIALAQVEANGIRIDVNYLQRTQREVKDSIQDLRRQLQEHEVYRLQVKRYGQRANLTSRPQLAVVLEQDLGFKIPYTKEDKDIKPGEKRRHKLDEGVLDSLDLDYGRLLLKLEKLNKLSGTYLSGVMNEVEDGLLHPFFNLHTVKTYRSSSDQPNFQNIPIRNEEVARLIRRAFVPRPGHVLVEVDYAALEFRIGACMWRDPAMVKYASDPDLDIHRDCAAEIYKTTRDQVNKKTRYCAKNKFVFPELYGDFFIPCAESCWDSIDLLKLEVDGVPMKDHLRDQGITKLGACEGGKDPEPNTFEWHLKNCEKKFYQWFPVLKENQEEFWARYKKTGEIELMTGFRIKGVWKRTFILNVVIQGPAFHLLLWSLIQVVKWLRKTKMRSMVVGQIHDCLFMDVHRSELQDVLAKVKQVMTQDVKRHFDWVITPLGIEAEVGEENWYEKKVIEV